MKLNKWLCGVMGLAMLASCSDDFKDGPVGGGQTDEGEGYIGISIQLPTVNSTRANDDFENSDGEISEYAVNDAVLLLFQGSSEANATFIGSFNLQEANPEYEDEPQVTRQSVRVASVKGVNPSSKLYALVMVNGIANGMYTKNNPTATWMKKGEGETATGKTIKEFQETELKDQKLFTQSTKGSGYASNIFMTNSPLSKSAGGQDQPIINDVLPVLVELNSKTWPTQKEALDNPAGTIHVERAVGKITCSDFKKETALTVKVNGYDYNLVVDQIWWDMAQDMRSTYVVRNTNRRLAGTNNTDYMWQWDLASSAVAPSSDDYYRMIGWKPLKVDADKYYRPYFCQVPGYNVPFRSSAANPDLGYFTKTILEFADQDDEQTKTKKTVEWSTKSAFYPRENTFPVEHMKYANTTRIGFWVTFEFKAVTGQTGAPAINLKDKNFYIKGMDKTEFFMDDDKGNNPLEILAIAELSDSKNYPELWAKIQDALDKTGTGSISVNLADIITLESKIGDDGAIAISSISFKTIDELHEQYGEKFKKVPEYSFDSHLAALNNLGQYYAYEGGRSFYEVRIQHFGKDGTPWDPEKHNIATNIVESYGEADGSYDKEESNNNYLGRYGIVRNNWYDLNVKAIKELGHPKDPALWEDNWHDTPDDNKDQYIAVVLRVLSWAKRTQDVDF